MNIGKTVSKNQFFVQFCSVSFMLIESIIRIFFGDGSHITIPADLRQNRSGRDTHDPKISLRIKRGPILDRIPLRITIEVVISVD